MRRIGSGDTYGMLPGGAMSRQTDRRDDGQNSMAVTVLLIVAGVTIFAFSGGVRSNFGIIIGPLADSSGVSYASLSFVLGIAQLMYGLTQPLWGILALKKSNSAVLLYGIPMMAGGLILTSIAHSSAAMFVTLGLMVGSSAGALCYGIIMGALSPILGPQKAAAASGILNAGSGIGGAVLSPVIQAISASAGINAALLTLAVPFIVLVPVILWMRGKETGAYASQDRKPADEDETDDAENENGSLAVFRKALATPDFRRLMIGFGTCGFHMIIIHTHMVSHFVSLGISPARAAFIYTAYGIFAMVGAITSGLLCTKFHLKNVLGSLYGTRAVAVALFLFIAPKNTLTMVVFAFILGMTGDATVTPTSEIISRRFGARTMGFLFGITYVCHQVGAFISSWLGGIFIGNMGNYNLIWIIDILLCTMASFVSFRITTANGE